MKGLLYFMKRYDFTITSDRGLHAQPVAALASIACKSCEEMISFNFSIVSTSSDPETIRLTLSLQEIQADIRRIALDTSISPPSYSSVTQEALLHAILARAATGCA